MTNIRLFVSEDDGGASIELPGEWSCEKVVYPDNPHELSVSVTTYRFANLDWDLQTEIEQALNSADGVLSYHWKAE